MLQYTMYQGALNGATLATKAMYVFVAIGFCPDVAMHPHEL